MAHDRYSRLQGEHVALTGSTGPFRLCPCGNDEGRVAEGSGPHLASVRCIACKTHVSWLGRDHLEALMAKYRGVNYG